MAGSDFLSTVARLEGELKEALALLDATPDCERLKNRIAAHYVDIGTNMKFAGRVAEGVAKYVESLRYNPHYAAAYYNLGVEAFESGRVEEAIAHYEKTIELNPCYSEALCNLGLIKQKQNDLEAAVEYHGRALRARPFFDMLVKNYCYVLCDLGTKREKAGHLREAIGLYEKSVMTWPFYPDAYYNLGVAWSGLPEGERDFEKALYYYQMATHFKPTYAEAWNNLGVTYGKLGSVEKAVECYERALHENPTFAMTMNNMAIPLASLGQVSRAQEMLRKCVALQPSNAEAWNNLGVVLRDEGVMTEALECYAKTVELCPENENAAQNHLLALNFSTTHTPDEIQQAHLDWGQRIMKTHAKPPMSLKTTMDPAKKKLRIGYVSPDFYMHSVSYFAHNVLKYHDPSAVEVFCFSNVLKPDSKTFVLQQLVEKERWVDIVGKPMDEAAEIIRDHEIDVLVDLTGHTATNRLDIFVRRPAPVQVTWIGYPNTTGLPTIDYRLTDAKVDPWDVVKPAHYAETLYRLPGSFLCYCPDTPAEGETAGHPNASPGDVQRKGYEVKYRGDVKPVMPKTTAFATKGYVTFGTFNNMAKINEEVVDVWAAILKRLPTARLFCKSKPFSEERVRDAFMQQFEAHGVDRSRITLIGQIPGHYNHLQAYENIDIGLDCWPYAGTTTTCEALWMGVPVVTMTGPLHAANVGASLVESVGAPELVASSREQYIDIAVGLADADRLLKYRAQMQSKMEKSLLCDGPAFMKNVEKAYREMFVAACKGEKHIQTRPGTKTPETADLRADGGGDAKAAGAAA